MPIEDAYERGFICLNGGDSMLDRSKELLHAVNADDYLVKVVEGHKLIDELLNEALAEALAYPNVLELQRIRFPVKVDILSALGYISPVDRLAYHKFNAVRNEFAHRRKAKFSEDEADRLWAAVSKEQRDILKFEQRPDPETTLAEVIALLYVQIEIAISHMRDEKARAMALHRRVQEVLGPRRGIKDEYSDRTDQEIEHEVQLDRERRRKRGEL